MYPPLLSSNKSAVAQKLSESLKKPSWFPVFFFRKEDNLLGCKYILCWNVTSLGTRGGKKNYDNGDYDESDDDDDDYDDGDD